MPDPGFLDPVAIGAVFHVEHGAVVHEEPATTLGEPSAVHREPAMFHVEHPMFHVEPPSATRVFGDRLVLARRLRELAALGEPA